MNQMYEIQRPAYEARSQLVGKPTDSTPDTPPAYPALDVVGLCNLKKSIVENLPTTCSHCGAEFPIGSIVELGNEEIVAYCKKPGACGRSQVLFAAVDFRTPAYKKVCIYSPKDDSSSVPDLSEIGHLQLMQMDLPTCAHCGQDEASHPPCDENGWSVVGYNNVSFPPDWPYFDGDTWGTAEYLQSIHGEINGEINE
jgi:hypothetical protein